MAGKRKRKVRKVGKKATLEEFVFKGDSELDMPKVIRAEPTIKGIANRLKKLKHVAKIVDDAWEVADEVEESFGGYAEVWEGYYTGKKTGKRYKIQGVWVPDWEGGEELYISIKKAK